MSTPPATIAGPRGAVALTRATMLIGLAFEYGERLRRDVEGLV